MDMLQLTNFFLRNYDVVLADYDVSPSCRFSHAMAHIIKVCLTKSADLSVFSAPEPKAQVHYCDHPLSVVRQSVRPSLLTFHIFNFFSETTKRNSKKLDRKQDLNILYEVCVFQADRKNKMAVLASDWL